MLVDLFFVILSGTGEQLFWHVYFLCFLLEVFEENDDYMALFIALNIYLVFENLEVYRNYYLYLHHMSAYNFDSSLYIYAKKETLIFSINFLTIAFLRGEYKRSIQEKTKMEKVLLFIVTIVLIGIAIKSIFIDELNQCGVY